MRMIKTLISNIVKRAYVSLSKTDDADIPVVQVSYLGKTGDSEMLSPYGLSVRLPRDIQVLLFAIQAQENNRLCMGYSQTDRFKNLEEGEVVIGNPLTKSFVKFDKDGNIDIESKAKIVINSTSDVEITNSGKLTVNSTGNVIISTNADVALNCTNIDIVASGDVSLKATGSVDVDAPQVNLGTGGAAIARVGDDVDLGTGKILTGGNNTSI